MLHHFFSTRLRSDSAKSIARFHDAIDHGETLLMVDAYAEREEEKAKDIMFARHNAAKYQGEDSHYREFL